MKIDITEKENKILVEMINQATVQVRHAKILLDLKAKLEKNLNESTTETKNTKK